MSLKNIGQQVLTAVRHSFWSLLGELKRIFGFTDKTTVPSADAQQMVNRVVSASVVLVGVLLPFLPGDAIILRTIANALFSAATWLWNGKEPTHSANTGRLPRDLAVPG